MVSEMTPARAGMAGGRRRTVREPRAPRMTAIPDGAGLMSRGPRARPRPKQLQEVVRQADHGPLGAYLREAAEGKAPKAATGFDVGENGLHDRFAALIDDFADRGPQLRAHLLARRATPVGEAVWAEGLRHAQHVTRTPYCHRVLFSDRHLVS